MERSPPRVLSNDLATFDRAGRRVPASASSIAIRPGLASKVGSGDRADQEEPDGYRLILARDAREPQRVLQHGKGEDGKDDARDGALAAVDVDAAEQHDGEDDQRQAGSTDSLRAGEAGGEDHAGERRDDAGQDEERGLQRADPDPGVPGRVLVLADREDLSAEPRAVGDEVEHDAEDREDDQRPGDRRAGDVAEAEGREAPGEVADSGRPQDHVRQAPEQGERAERDDQGWKADPGHEQPVEEPAERSHHEDDRDPDLDRDSRRPQPAEDRAG